jgi:hypothetical protein
MRFSELLFLAVLASIPIQLNKFFFPQFSFVLGIPIDYLAVSVYFIDILIILLFCATIIKPPKNFYKFLKNKKSTIYLLGAFDIYLFLNAYFFSQSQTISLLFALKILEFSLFCVIATYFFSQKNVFKKSQKIIAFTVTWQATIAIFQFLLQRSLGLHLLGERSFDSTTVSIAHTQIFGSQFLRSYGTFPHPNILGAYFLISLILISTNRKKNQKLFSLSTLMSGIGLILTFSKTALFMAIASVVNLKNKRKTLLAVLILSATLAYLYLTYLNQSYLESIAERIILISSSLEIAKANLFFGVGSNNFILAISKYNLTSISQVRLLQPVHNVFLLILSENGLIGLTLFFLFLQKISGQVNTKLKGVAFLVLMAYLSLDHFMWTLEQGQLLLFLALAYILSSQKEAAS